MNQTEALGELNRTELDHKMKSLVRQERELLHEILLTIKEIDRRRIYLEIGYPSLFSYLVEGIGYSEGSAQRRIDGARLLAEVPELAARIQAGELKLSQIAMVQKAAREIFKQTATKVVTAQKAELLNQVLSKGHRETQATVAAYFDIVPTHDSSMKVQADEGVRLEITLSKELYEKIKQAQALVSHSVPKSDITAFLDYVADRIIKQKTSARVSGNTGAVVEKQVGLPSSHFRPSVKKAILGLQKCCQYVDPMTGKRCSSTWYLQIDHRQSKWAGGDGSIENAQVLCGMHNRFKYRKECGVRAARFQNKEV